MVYYILHIFLVFIALNVPAVYDVFVVAIKEREAFQQPQKCGGEKYHKGRSPTGVLRSLAAVRRRTLTDLLGAVIFTFYHLLSLYFLYIYPPIQVSIHINSNSGS